MMVIAKHFPGRGDSDRSPEEEVATVRKSLEQLKQVELPPFFAVTNSSDPAGNCRWFACVAYSLSGVSGKYPGNDAPGQF